MNVRILPETLSKVPLLEGLSDDILNWVANHLIVRAYKKGEYLIHKGGRGDELFFLLKGRLLVLDLTADGRQTGVNFLTPGDFFGELALLDDLPRSASIMAISPVIVFYLSKNFARELIYKVPTVAERMLKHTALRLRLNTDYRAILSIPNVIQRVCALLWMLAKLDPGKLMTIENMPTHQHIALMANTTRETISRVLAYLSSNAIVEKDNQRLIIRDSQELVRLVEHGVQLRPHHVK